MNYKSPLTRITQSQGALNNENKKKLQLKKSNSV